MVKKFLLMVILLAGTALTLVFGDIFELPVIEEKPTATASFTAQPTETVQVTVTSSIEPTATTEATATPEEIATDLPTPTLPLRRFQPSQQPQRPRPPPRKRSSTSFLKFKRVVRFMSPTSFMPRPPATGRAWQGRCLPGRVCLYRVCRACIRGLQRSTGEPVGFDGFGRKHPLWSWQLRARAWFNSPRFARSTLYSAL